MLRNGLRNDDVQALVRAVRAARDSGLGPDEAWSVAKKEVQGVDPRAFEGWRKEVEARAEAGTAAVPRTTTANILQRAAELEEENGRIKRKLADAGVQYEGLVKEAKAKLDELRAENAKLKEQLAAAEELLSEKKGKK